MMTIAIGIPAIAAAAAALGVVAVVAAVVVVVLVVVDSDGSTEGGQEERRPSESQGQTSAYQAAPATSQTANPSHECCPTCGTTNFCVGCGAPNEHFQLYQMKLVQTQMSMMPGNVGQMMMPVFPGQNGFVPVCMPAGMVPMTQQPMMGNFEGSDNSQPTGVYLMPAQMVQGIQPGMMVCDGSKTAYSMSIGLAERAALARAACPSPSGTRATTWNAPALVKIAKEAGQHVPEWLEKAAAKQKQAKTKAWRY
eukprot:s3424_g5.t1